MTDSPFTIPNRSGGVCYQATDATDLRGAVLEAVGNGAYLSGAYLSDADLRGAYLSGAYLSGAYLSGANLSDADLRGAYLSGANLSDADLRGAYLSGADLRGAYLSGANLSDADLRGANLSGADLRGAYLSGADLRGADLSDAYLSGADLRGANLSDADLRGAYLSGANLHASSRMAYAGPVGDGYRPVHGFLADADETHAAPYLLLQCGCFTGDEVAYLARVDERYPAAPTGPSDARMPEWRAQCLAALAGVKAIVATWPITEPAAEVTTEKQEVAS